MNIFGLEFENKGTKNDGSTGVWAFCGLSYPSYWSSPEGGACVIDTSGFVHHLQ